MAKNQKEEVQETSVVEAQSTAVAVDLSEWGDADVGSRDIIIPKLLMQQSTSEMVGEGLAKLGDIVDNTTGAIVGGVDKPVRVIPFHMERTWIISSREAGKGDSRFEFEKYEPVTAANQGYPFSEIVGGREVKYEYTMQFYVLLESDPTLPYVVAFKSTSQRAGKVLSTQMYIRNKAAGLTPASYVMEISASKEKNDKGTFAVMNVKPAGKTPDELVASCLKWLKIVKAGAAKVAPEKTGNAPAGNYADENAPF